MTHPVMQMMMSVIENVNNNIDQNDEALTAQVYNDTVDIVAVNITSMGITFRVKEIDAVTTTQFFDEANELIALMCDVFGKDEAQVTKDIIKRMIVLPINDMLTSTELNNKNLLN